uniref:hypothetical protein n=1 Tax=Amycolatopsis sp. CA-096443 TaxID=3239919 RepID=UPI003F4977FB
MSDTEAPSAGVQGDLRQIERTARALARADGSPRDTPEVRNRYSGPALTVVSAYLAPADPGDALAERR